jgi:hypothetical protein
MNRALKGLAILLLATLLPQGTALALPVPAGPVLLVVRGAIGETNGTEADGHAVARFDRTMLDALPRRDAVIGTPWTPAPVRYSGAYLKAVLEAVGARGGRLIVRALNDYEAELPVDDAWRLDTMLADRIDGKPLSVREKGPLMLVYPFDQDHALYNERYFSRSVWQIREIEVRP